MTGTSTPSSAPAASYAVWHTQRTGSTLLCTTLAATGVAGHPDEWPEDRLADCSFEVGSIDADSARAALWRRQTTPNNVLGVKWSYHQPWIDGFFRMFRQAQSGARLTRREAWESVFPNCRHVVMTRRNKIRLAVSWWKSISGGRWHVSNDGSALPWQHDLPNPPADLADAYRFDAIKALALEAVVREAGIQDLLVELGVSPLSVTYEDFVASYESTVRDVLRHLDLSHLVPAVPPPLLAPTSDAVNEEWVRRFLDDLARDR